ncbi:ribosome biogenesis factor YjgA [Dokdonella sp. MW10]|uniref:ribosome biogenesis factor YjgA n=1 Tax=Dokdonella sp. MW10 TaxID=2992926 RepID=UPI003F7FD62F
MSDETHDDDTFDGPSRSQQRRDAIAVFKLAEQLVALPEARLARLPLPEDILEEVRKARLIRQQIAHKRQVQFLAKHMRRLDDEDLAPVRALLDNDRQQSYRQTAALHQLEAWRDRLLAEGDEALTAWFEAHPDADRQQLRNLVRQARHEAEKGKPPRAARELFRTLREQHEAAQG